MQKDDRNRNHNVCVGKEGADGKGGRPHSRRSSTEQISRDDRRTSLNRILTSCAPKPKQSTQVYTTGTHQGRSPSCRDSNRRTSRSSHYTSSCRRGHGLRTRPGTSRQLEQKREETHEKNALKHGMHGGAPKTEKRETHTKAFSSCNRRDNTAAHKQRVHSEKRERLHRKTSEAY